MNKQFSSMLTHTHAQHVCIFILAEGECVQQSFAVGTATNICECKRKNLTKKLMPIIHFGKMLLSCPSTTTTTTMYEINKTVKNAGLHCNTKKITEKMMMKWEKDTRNGTCSENAFVHVCEWPKKYTMCGYDAMKCIKVSNKLTSKESTTSVFFVAQPKIHSGSFQCLMQCNLTTSFRHLFCCNFVWKLKKTID